MKAPFVEADVRHGQPLSEEARKAIIEHNRVMKDVRRFAAENRERIDAEWAALPSPPRTIEGHVSAAREAMGGRDA